MQAAEERVALLRAQLQAATDRVAAGERAIASALAGAPPPAMPGIAVNPLLG